MPPRPHWKFSASARIAEKQMTMLIKTMNEVMRGSLAYVRLPEQPLRPEHEHQRDRSERDADAIVRRHHERRKLARHSDQQRADESTERASQSAEDRRAEHPDDVVRAHRRLERSIHADQHAADREQHPGDEPGPADDSL